MHDKNLSSNLKIYVFYSDQKYQNRKQVIKMIMIEVISWKEYLSLLNGQEPETKVMTLIQK